ncbi:MAG: hypothetical protein CO029_02475 [Candidatus Magasanikbacteria bacterium CG_4_9_14_0_2_um_filter_41_10]|uniref:Uncharacterized protein n=1 Tax=Candidatus Magasanikbacteria bacterium CG_4_10_14_0_2_um_filter_41_31 TaxID=1974639 RepID=A0A2M7V4A1_9BACT|nr:MAG: hypothetical protein AUJ37_00260 [Candidatus Magasanikbacteria bacterium CG1_02_41_34]PIZ93373.1 MAG: hypothetical protein COX83_02155 [Candidatus Magasanikbacteria bacterium CG_4_10_14_0_2_um_filter_41_31]PJC53489.1 MAG: hypothetical protein CO029_02475 [Candidatus Magasanikbacteria bacterium CG_4_9_14_0_2_um_filter_41_10]
MTTLTVQGMHCDACKKLIMMELEDAGLGDSVVDITLKPENIGELQLAETVTSNDEEKIISIINTMETYSIV